ncbi:MAG: glutamate synthase large subunit [Oligoflexia bacterium]|nr:glutamate synthase large subunit [Oligoflexia bacterium]
MKPQGLYDPRFEKDSCGVGMVAHLRGEQSFSIVSQGLEILRNLFHRGAQGADSLTGDGAGILTQIPHELLVSELASVGIRLPEKNQYAVGMVFLPQDPEIRSALSKRVERFFLEKDLPFLGWRDVPTDSSSIGRQAREREPFVRQFFVARAGLTEASFERRLYIARRKIENASVQIEDFHIPSLSSRTIVYKGLLLPSQVDRYYSDLRDPRFMSALAVVHSRFSTNTMPSWPLAHPYRYLCHNGEINTIQGNLNWMRARQGKLRSPLFGKELTEAFPIVQENQSDSASLDNALEFLTLGGRSLAHSMMMLIPEPWNANPQMDIARRAFYQYHSTMMEPWDGPAAVCFTDGKVIGATLDRNGLRPCRYQITTDDRVILASEAGVLPLEPSRIRSKGRLEPGKMFLVDLTLGRIVEDEEIKSEIASRKPYRSWVTENRISLDELPEPAYVPQPDSASLLQRQRTFGLTAEEIKIVLTPMGVNGEEPLSSMGNDTPLAALSEHPQLLFKYFRQLFAQVTNPPIDPIREQLVMSLVTGIGPRPNLLSETPEAWRQIKIQQPILSNEDMAKIRAIADPGFKSVTLKTFFPAASGPLGMRKALIQLCRDAAREVRAGCRFLILSDRGVNEELAPISSLLAVAAVQHHLVRKSLRAECGLIVESGEPRDVHHFACLIGYGAGSVNPYLAFDTFVGLEREGNLPEGIDAVTAHSKYIKAIDKGLLKIFSKMGISTIQSYCGAQIFEAIGIEPEVIDRYFTNTPSRVGGVGLKEIAEETLRRHRGAFSVPSTRDLDPGGEVHYRAQGEIHAWNPETIAKLQHATKSGDARTFREFSELANGREGHPTTLRGLLDFDFPAAPVPREEVEPATEIVKRFTTGAMSLGALGTEAHETLAIAMNRIGGKSNSGEGGEDPARFEPLENGDSKNSAIKQVASARFGVTAHYLSSARELQIKVAQGAKPGEGGQLPGPKVDATIARLRHSTPGVGLISPPPHHDIYSIEDLAQLIFDLKNSNPRADVSVKLVSEVGVGSIAAGVAKAHADKILISGDSGGTGASPLSSIKYAGAPWELGLAETHQTLVLNGLRGRVKLETDGQMKTGRDVVIAALLGAEEFGFSTAPLIVEGCVMMRKCHLNTCPVGVATQDPVLRALFKGKPEHVINYFFFVAEEVRELMARLGFRAMSEMIGRADRLRSRPAPDHWKARTLDLAMLLHVPRAGEAGVARRKLEAQDHGLDSVLDRELLSVCAPSLERKERTVYSCKIRNSNRSTGTMLSGEIARRFGAEGLPSDTIELSFQGSAGQSFGAFLAAGVTLKLEGESNDYIGKGLSGGKIIVVPPKGSLFSAEDTILVGNTAFYGATSGEAYLRGRAGERFAVRNSGAIAVVEGVGDHGCEYMTGGRVVVIGNTGKNFAAGMSGGIAYVLDEAGRFSSCCNTAMVELEAVQAPEDVDELRRLLEAHRDYTGSRKADSVLSRWPEVLNLFVKVIPTDYKRALAQMKSNPKAVGVVHG